MVVDLVRRVPGWEEAEPTVTPIVGGITNRNFRVDIGGSPSPFLRDAPAGASRIVAGEITDRLSDPIIFAT